MLSKALLKRLNSLKMKKFRDAENLFIAEGERLVFDLLPHFSPQLLLATRPFLDAHAPLLSSLPCEIHDVTPDEMSRITLLNTPSPIYTLFQKNLEGLKNLETLKNLEGLKSLEGLESLENLILALDKVQDPGNLGTIIRTADWFGVRHILCSHGTADLYNPKVIQSTMGAIARVSLHYCDLPSVLSSFRDAGWNLYGTFLDGTSLYDHTLRTSRSIIVMGNEGNGISPAVSSLITDRLLIPSYPPGTPTSESLNVSIATAIILSTFRSP